MKFFSQINENELYVLIESESISRQSDMTELFEIAKDAQLPVVLDLKNVKSAGSGLVNALVTIKKETNLQITVKNANEDILTLFEIVGLQHLIRIEDEHCTFEKTGYSYFER